MGMRTCCPPLPWKIRKIFKKSASTLGLALLSLFFLFGQAMAQERPFQLSLVGPTLQLVDDDADIKGLRLNLIYGVNENVTGLDLGLINIIRSKDDLPILPLVNWKFD